MTTYKELWWQKMLEKYQTEEAVRAAMSEAAKRRKKKTGFTKKTAKKAGKAGADKRWGNDGKTQHTD